MQHERWLVTLQALFQACYVTVFFVRRYKRRLPATRSLHSSDSEKERMDSPRPRQTLPRSRYSLTLFGVQPEVNRSAKASRRLTKLLENQTSASVDAAGAEVPLTLRKDHLEAAALADLVIEQHTQLKRAQVRDNFVSADICR